MRLESSTKSAQRRFGKSVQTRLEEERRDAQPTATGCLLCEWSHIGPAGEGREAAAEHRREAHPGVGERRKGRRRRG